MTRVRESPYEFSCSIKGLAHCENGASYHWDSFQKKRGTSCSKLSALRAGCAFSFYFKYPKKVLLSLYMKENKILKWAVILSIVIIANLFFNYSLSLTLNSPEYDQFCSIEKTTKNLETKDACEKEDGIWTPIPAPGSGIQTTGQCDLYTKCNLKYQEADKVYEQKVFIALVVIGVVVLAASFFVNTNPVLGSAFALTAVLDFVVASIRYWSYSDELLKVGILFIALVALIYLAVKKFKDKI